MDAFWIIVGLGLVIWAFYSLLDPPQKYKDYSLTDQQEAAHRALGGSRLADASDVKPPLGTKKRG